MVINRMINGTMVYIELSMEELMNAHEEYELHLMLETVKGTLNSGCYSEFEDLGDDAWEEAAKTIAQDAIALMEECGDMCDSDAAQHAIHEYILHKM